MNDYFIACSIVCILESSLNPYVKVEKEAEENSSLFLVFERLLAMEISRGCRRYFLVLDGGWKFLSQCVGGCCLYAD